VTPLPDPVPSSGDACRPPFPLTMPWYIEHRLDEQMRYYANGQTENEEGVRRYRVAGFAAAVISAILGVAASNFGQGWFAPWVGVMTTLAAAATAYGLLDRRQYLAGSYGAMVSGCRASRSCSRTVRATCPRWSRQRRICCRANTAPGSSARRRRLRRLALRLRNAAR
jgi:SMODS and SLOG-associating 2TM effector domain 1